MADRHEDKRARMAVATAVLASGGLALLARTAWDDAYQAEQGALIGQPIAFFLGVGFVTGISVGVGVTRARGRTAAAATAAATALAWVIAASGGGFLTLTAASLVFGGVLASIGAISALGLSAGVRWCAR